MSKFIVEGGRKLKGKIQPQGAKNEALQVICATLLTSEKVVLNNIPDIRDVNKLIELISSLGSHVEKLKEGTYSFQARSINLEYLESPHYIEQSSALRGSVMILGPLLARSGKASMPKPGGDKIGRRKVDTHLTGFQNLGASFSYDPGKSIYFVSAKKLTGCYMHLDEASVTGTANIVMAAVLARGQTTIYNAACEPYVQQLCRMLVSMGAKIEGIGSNLLHIQGVSDLGAVNIQYYRI